MTEQTITVAECDRRLLVMHATYTQAIEQGDTEKAFVTYDMLDALLDMRIHLPQQRAT